jgi:hypothetical protein
MEKFGQVLKGEFTKENAIIEFDFEIAWDNNLYDQKDEVIDEQCVKCNEDVASVILEELFDVNPVFDAVNGYECFYDKESGTVKVLNEDKKTLTFVNVANFRKIEKVSYDSL